MVALRPSLRVTWPRGFSRPVGGLRLGLWTGFPGRRQTPGSEYWEAVVRWEGVWRPRPAAPCPGLSPAGGPAGGRVTLVL